MKISPRKVSKNKQPLSLVKLPKSKDISTIITPFPYSYYAKLSHKKYTDLFYCRKTCSNYCQNLTQKNDDVPFEDGTKNFKYYS